MHCNRKSCFWPDCEWLICDVIIKKENIISIFHESWLMLLNVKLTCVRPAELPALGVKGQSVGQPQPFLHQHRPVAAVQTRALDLRPVSVPVGPVQISGGWTERRVSYMWLWSREAVISNTGIFVATANNTLYGSKLSIFLLCQKSLGY